MGEGPWWYTEVHKNVEKRSVSMIILWIYKNFVYFVWQIADQCVPRIWLYSARLSLQGHKVHKVHDFLFSCARAYACPGAYKAYGWNGYEPRHKSLKILLASKPSMSFTNSVVFWAIPPPYKDTHHDNGSGDCYNAR
jgi:hypothetical protein